nr:PD40 domain-containing protein [Bacteroidota bacterium]
MKITGLFILTMIISLTAVFAQEKIENNSNFPIFEGNYLGQKPPGITPEIFAPNIISTGDYERALVFSPDYNELYYQMRGREYNTFIIHMEKENDRWLKPEMASFSGVNGYNDGYPFFSPDGKKLFFDSNRPFEPGGEIQKNVDIWFLEKKTDVWSDPVHLPSPVNSNEHESTPSVALNGNLYFESNRDSENSDWGIFVSKFKNGVYQKPEKLSVPVNSEKYEGHVYITPDESYMLFDSDREGGYGDLDIYVSFNIEGKWSEAYNLGDKINTYSHEVAPYVSPDGEYLFFTTFKLTPDKSKYSEKKFSYDELKAMLNSPGNGYGDIYWVDAKVIQELKP